MAHIVFGNSSFWLFAVNLPLLAALLLAVPPLRRHVVAAVPWTAVPALALALWAEPDSFVDIPWLLLGTRFGIDDTGRVFLVFTAALWIVCGQYARVHLAQDANQYRFFMFFLASMAGNLGVTLAADMITFYLFFALMSFASYGLVIHEGDPDSLRAGRVYIAFVIGGEILLFVGTVAIASSVGSVDFTAVREAFARSPPGKLMLVFVLAGFAVKTGAVPLHMWLPVVYRAAPIPAAAVLSGPMIKAGLLGWLRFFPLGEIALPVLGTICVVGGFMSAFWGIVVGLAQRDPKAALGYSSISQMGLITTGVGVGLLAPESWGLMLPAIWLYAVHHALAKAALFLGMGIWTRRQSAIWKVRMATAGLILSAATLAGLPLTSGAVAKLALKKSIESAPIPVDLVEFLLSVAAAGTTLLMVRFLVLIWPQRKSPSEPLATGLWTPWLALLAGVALWVWSLTWAGFQNAAVGSLAPPYIWSALWPPVVGIAGAWGVWRFPRVSGPASRIRIRAGDLLPLLARLFDRVRRIAPKLERRLSPAAFSDLHFPQQRIDGTLSGYATYLEARLKRWDVVGLLILALVATLLAFLAR
jgi:formate hydrogenlyase subunit 3/multisubunit Na+/H+ antiporter MnhD subunit